MHYKDRLDLTEVHESSLNTVIVACAAGRPYGGATILAKPIDITGQNQPGKILAGTAMPVDSFLIGTS